MDKILTIKQSLRCLKLGWLALIPVIGPFIAIYAIHIYCRVFLASDDWNPAKAQLYSGAALALTSVLLHAIFVSTVIWSAIK
jgi:hypothetical protein